MNLIILVILDYLPADEQQRNIEDNFGEEGTYSEQWNGEKRRDGGRHSRSSAKRPSSCSHSLPLRPQKILQKASNIETKKYSIYEVSVGKLC